MSDVIDALADWWDRTDDRPWCPPGLVFKPGDRVVVRLTNECELHNTRTSPSLLARVEGLTGVVDRLDAPEWWPTHPIAVSFDHPFSTGRGRVVGGVFAWGELLPDPAPGEER